MATQKLTTAPTLASQDGSSKTMPTSSPSISDENRYPLLTLEEMEALEERHATAAFERAKARLAATKG